MYVDSDEDSEAMDALVDSPSERDDDSDSDPAWRPSEKKVCGDLKLSCQSTVLMTHVKSAPSLDAFTDRLKTELFRRSYA